MGNDVLSAGFFLMIIGSCYTFFKDLFVSYYNEVQSWFYVSVEVQEGDDTYKWLSGMYIDLSLLVPTSPLPPPITSYGLCRSLFSSSVKFCMLRSFDHFFLF